MKEKSPLRQKDVRTGAQQERKRILAILEKFHDSEYGGMPTLDELIQLIEEETQ